MFKVTMDKQITNTVKIEIPNKYTGVHLNSIKEQNVKKCYFLCNI